MDYAGVVSGEALRGSLKARAQASGGALAHIGFGCLSAAFHVADRGATGVDGGDDALPHAQASTALENLGQLAHQAVTRVSRAVAVSAPAALRGIESASNM